MQFRILRGGAPQPPASSNQAPKKPGLRQRFRLLARLAVFGLLGLAALASIGFFIPWSLPPLDRYLQARWLEATGLPLSYRKATIYLSRGAVVIKNPTLLDPQSGQPLHTARRIRIEAPVGQFFLGKPPYLIRSVNVETSALLEGAWQKGQLKLAPPWERILTLVREHFGQAGDKAPARTPGWFGLGRLRIGSAGVAFSAEREGQPQVLFSLRNLSIDCDFQGTMQPREIFISGYLNSGEPANELRLSVQPDPAGQQADFKLRLNHFDSVKDLPFFTPVQFHGKVLEIAGRLARQAGNRWTIQGHSMIDRIELTGNESWADQDVGQAQLNVDLSVDTRAGRLDLNRLDLASGICSLATSGTLETRPPFLYTLQVNPLKLQGQGLALLAGQWGQAGILVRPGEAVASLDATIQGALGEKRQPLVVGQFHVAGLSLASESFPPLDNLQLEAEMTSQSLVIRKGRVAVLGMPVELTGQVKGRHPLSGEIQSADLSWQAKGSLSGLTALVNGQSQGFAKPDSALQLSGRVAGEGRVRVAEPMQGTLTSVLNRTRLDGELNLEGVRVSHPSLTGPIGNVKGRFVFSTHEARLERGRGEWMGAKIDLSGTRIEGKPLFWIDPQLKLKGELSAELGELQKQLALLPEPYQNSIRALPEMKGRADLSVQVETDLKQPDRAQFTGRLALQDFSTVLQGEAFSEPIYLKKAHLNFNPSQVILTQATGKWGEIDLDATGELKPGGGTVHAILDGEINEFGARAPILAEFFKAGGAARADNTWSIKARKGFNPPETWLKWRTYWNEHKPAAGQWRPWLGERWTVDGSGVVHLRDAELTYRPMPARLRNITGPFRYNMERLWVPDPLPVKGGENSKNTQGTVEVVFGKTLNDLLQGKESRTTFFRFAVIGEHLDLNEWFKPWDLSLFEDTPDKLHPLSYDPTIKPFFSLHGEFKTRSALFGPIAGSDFRAKMDMDFHHEQSDMFRWGGISAKIYDGGLTVEGSRVKEETRAAVTMDKVKLEPLIKALSDKDRVQGIFSGNLSGQANLHWLRSENEKAPSPLVGEGQLRIENSRFVSNSIFHSLGGLLKLPILEDITFSTIHGPFKLRDQKYISDNLIFDNPLLNLQLVGAAGPQRKLDLVLQLQFKIPIVGEVPIVKQAMDGLNKLTGKVFRVKVGGTLDAPATSLL